MIPSMFDSRYATYPSLRGRHVVVSGGASGIGESIVQAFALQGAQTVLLDIDQPAASALLARLDRPEVLPPAYFHCDLTDIAALQATMTEVQARFGPIDVLVNNAGNDTRHQVEEVTSASWDHSLAVNLKHQFFMAQAVMAGMRERQHGSIINMSSIGWIIPSTSLPVYVTAKAAIVGLTRTLAHELGPDNIRVNCVLPGAIATERQQTLWYTEEYKARVLAAQALKRTLSPDEVARLVLFLASDDSAAITNQSYAIDGGWV